MPYRDPDQQRAAIAAWKEQNRVQVQQNAVRYYHEHRDEIRPQQAGYYRKRRSARMARAAALVVARLSK